MADNRERGLYNKFQVKRVDGDPKHDNCNYFVLDIDHDPFAVPALLRYADVCASTYPALAADLQKMVQAQKEKQYLALKLYPYDGDEKVIEVKESKMLTTIKPQLCIGNRRKPSHSLPERTRTRHDKAMIDGKWHSLYVCTVCLEYERLRLTS